MGVFFGRGCWALVLVFSSIAGAATDTKQDVLIHLPGKAELTACVGKDRAQCVATTLKSFTKHAAKRIYDYLAAGHQAETTPIWITNSLRVVAAPDVIKGIVALGVGESVVLEQPHFAEELRDIGHPFHFIPHWQPEMGWGVRKIEAPQAWEIGARGQGVRIAVIDTGANMEHPDLAPALWTNTGETGLDDKKQDRATNGLDDDGNGYVDDVHGWNFEQRNGALTDYEGHGSKAAGIVVGTGAGGLQTGVAPGAQLMVLRICCDSVRELFESHAWEAMQYAMENGAQVISMSLTVKPNSKPSAARWRRAGEALLAADIVHVNSAGNLGNHHDAYNIGSPASNPPAWFHPGEASGDRSSMIAVGATDEADHVRSYSSNGPVSWETVPEYKDYPYDSGRLPGLVKPEVCAPSQTPSLDRVGKGYVTSFGGTSSSTPHVAGAAALLRSLDPELTVAQVTEALEMSATAVGTDFNNQCGAGRVDVYAALQYVLKKFPR